MTTPQTAGPRIAPGQPLPGTPYRIVRRLGKGGMGDVFEVEHVEVGSIRVLKLLREEFAGRADLIDRMRVEAQSLAALDHPNIVKVLDFGRLPNDNPYLVLERLRGRTLGEELRQRLRVPVYVAVEYTRQALLGLAAAHAIGVVHRDIKPDNLFIHVPQHGPRAIKILDFGIAKVLEVSRGAPAPPIQPTAEGAVIGTPRYLAPEQAAGRSIDARTDIYAAGLVLYSLVAGRGPFDDMRREAAIAVAHISQIPEPPSRYAHESIPLELDRAVLKALAKDPNDRYQSAAEFAAELDKIAGALRQPVGWLETTILETGDTQSGSAAEGAPLSDSGPYPMKRGEPTVPLEPSDRNSAGLLIAAGGDPGRRRRVLVFFALAAATACVVAALMAHWVSGF